MSWASEPHPDDPRSELGNDGLTDEERESGIAPMFEPPVVIHGDTICPGAGCDHPIHG